MKFFISYTKSDTDWATWVAWVLEKNGHTALIQAWDMHPGDNFFSKMHEFLRECDVCVPVLSKEYFSSEFCWEEWTNAFACEVKEKKKRFVPVKIDDVKPEGLFYAKIYIDLSVINNENAAEKELLVGLRLEEKDRLKPPFPNANSERTVPFPGAVTGNNSQKPGSHVGNSGAGRKRPKTPHNLPDRNVYFIEQGESLSAIEGYFAQDNIVCLKQTIAGMGGVGKTQTALEYAYRSFETGEYKDAIWWVHAETEEGARRDCLDFAEAVGLLPEGLDEARKLASEELGRRLKKWFAEHDFWLFVFDNVEQYKVIEPYVPRVGVGHILITTRDTGMKQGNSVGISFFKPDEAIDFMRWRLAEKPHLIDSNDALADLIQRLGYYQLALEHAAAFMFATEASCSDYLSMLDDKGLATLSLKEYISDKYHFSVLETLERSFGKLNDSAMKLLSICAYMSPDGIPLELFFRKHGRIPQPLQDDLGDKQKIAMLVGNLIQFSLLKREGQFLSMHRIVREIVRELLKDGDVDTDWMGISLEIVVDEMPGDKDYGYPEKRKWFKLMVPHALIVADYYKDANVSDADQEMQLAALYHSLGIGNMHFARYDNALEWYKKASAIYKKVLGAEHPSTASTYHKMALVYRDQGEYEKALEWNKKALTICEKILGAEHPSTASTYNSMAFVYRDQGEYEKALEWYKKALTIREKVLGAEHPSTATTYHNMALVYRDQGEYEKALEWYKKALTIREKVLGTEHPSTASTYNSMALVYRAQGEYEKALEWYKKALTIREKVLGADHPSTAITYNNMAFVYQDQGDNKTALEWFLKCYSIYRIRFGETHKFTVDVVDRMKNVFDNTVYKQPFVDWLRNS